MKRIKIFIALAILMTWVQSTHAEGQQPQTLNQIQLTPGGSHGHENLVGRVDRQGFLQEPFSEWFQQNYDEYQPDEDVLAQVVPLLKDIEITVFMGTWCSDSRREVPRFYKILDDLKFDEKNLEVYAQGFTDDGARSSLTGEEEGRNIIRVPTIIIQRNGKEIGRIIESPVNTLEDDTLDILEGNDYWPNHGAETVVRGYLAKHGLQAFTDKVDSIATYVNSKGISEDELAYYVARKLILAGKLNEAIAVTNMMMKIYPENPSYFMTFALIEQVRGDGELALQNYSKAAELMKDDEFLSSAVAAIGEWKNSK